MATIGESLSNIDKVKQEAEALKVQNRLHAEKIKQLDLLEKLSQQVKTHIEGQPGQITGFGSEDSPADQQVPGRFAANPSLTPQVSGGTPGQSTGNKLIDMLLPMLVRTGNLPEASKFIEQTTDPVRQIQKKFAEGMLTGKQPSGMDMSNINPNFLVGGTKEMFAPTEAHKIADPNNPGGQVWGIKPKYGNAITPTGVVADVPKLEFKESKNADGSVTYKALNPYTGKEAGTAGGGTIPTEITIEKDGTIKIPKGTPMELVTEALDYISRVGTGGGRTGVGMQKEPSPLTLSQSEPIKITDFDNWINPKTGKKPTRPMTTPQMEASGFVPYKPLSATDEAVFPLAVNSVPELEKVYRWLFPNGQLNKTNWAKLQAGVGEGAGMKGKVIQAVWAQLRKETGAAVTKEEAEAKFSEYILGMKGVTDPDGIKDGMRRLRDNLNGFIQQADPSGVHRKLLGANPKPSLEMGKTAAGKSVVRTGTYNGRKVIQYDDGSVEYGK